MPKQNHSKANRTMYNFILVYTRLFLTCSRVWLKLLWVGHAKSSTPSCATPDSSMPQSVLARMLHEADPSIIEAVALGWRLGRLFVRWRLFVEMCVRRRHLANQPSIEAVALYWRASRQDIRLRWLAETSQLRLTAVARVVLLQRRLDAATIKHVLSYLR